MKLTINIFLFFALCSVEGFAQVGDTLKFTLLGAIQQAVTHNPQLKSTQLNEENNRYKINEVRASGLPQLDAVGTATDNFQIATQLLPGEFLGQPGTTIPVKFGTRFIYGGNLRLSQALYNPSLKIGLQAATQSQGLYALQTFKSKEDLIYNVVNLYMQLRMAEKQQDLIAGNIARTARLLDITTTQYKEGIIKRVDVEQLKVNYTNLQTQLSNTSNSISQLLNNLKLLMNIEVAQPIAITEIGTETTGMATIDQQLNRELQLEANTELTILDQQVQLQQLNTKNIKVGYLPTLALAANLGKQWQTNVLFKTGTPGFSSGYYSLNLVIPLFDGFARRNRIAQSDIALKQLQLNKEYMTKNIQTQFQSATNDLNQNQKVIQAQVENMKVAEDLYNVANLSYTEGITALSELINAENGLREAQSQYLTAMLQKNLAELDMMKSSGQLSQLIKTALLPK